MPKCIGDYGVIGDGRTAALISKDGALEWLCWPRFDSPALFSSLLDSGRGGAWRIGPRERAKKSHRYIEGTNVLETRFETSGGEAVLTDFMPASDEDARDRWALPEDSLVRIVRCTGGELQLDFEYTPRPDFSRRAPYLVERGAFGVREEGGSALVTLVSEAPLALEGQETVRAQLSLRRGDVVRSVLSWADEAPAQVPPLGAILDAHLEETVRWWRSWLGGCPYQGPWRPHVLRSALALKLLQYAPSGAIVAAPTTSLPERVGGGLNWDYRFCWVRDAAFTIRALFGLGFAREAEAFLSWLLHATHGTQRRLHVMYDVYGRNTPREQELRELSGFRGSPPVRVGNKARDQLQLDAYGEIIDAAAELVWEGGGLDPSTSNMLVDFGKWTARRWHRPDEGIWEPRSGRRLYTHSRALCAVGLYCLLDLHEAGRIKRLPRDLFEREAAAIRSAVEEHAWNADLQSYTQSFNDDKLDANLLALPIYDFFAPDDRRMRKTYERIRERLGPRPGAIYRYEQSLGQEGAFVLCAFWAAEYLAMGGGTLDEAVEVFEDALKDANDLGLLSEMVDPQSRDLLGNYPQAFSHVGLINAALRIEERMKRVERREGERVGPTRPRTEGGVQL